MGGRETCRVEEYERLYILYNIGNDGSIASD